MRLLSIALLCAAISSSAFAGWTTVWKKTQEGDSPESILNVINKVDGAFDFLVTRELQRRVSGLPDDKLVNLVHTIKMDKWEGKESTCTIDDPRQYEAVESGAFSWSKGASVIFASDHEYRGEDWNPCAFEMDAEKRRMPGQLPITFTTVKH